MYRSVFGTTYTVNIPLEHIHCISFQRLTPQQATKGIVRVRIDFQSPGGWQVYTFSLRGWRSFADTLATATSLTISEIEPLALEPQPVNATRMIQDIYGQWHLDFTDMLYLAPDRLVFAWQDVVLLGDIQSLTLYDQHTPLDVLGALNPFSQDILRIDYIQATNTERQPRQVIGFQMLDARKWAERIAARADVPLTLHSERKKIKSGV